MSVLASVRAAGGASTPNKPLRTLGALPTTTPDLGRVSISTGMPALTVVYVPYTLEIVYVPYTLEIVYVPYKLEIVYVPYTLEIVYVPYTLEIVYVPYTLSNPSTLNNLYVPTSPWARPHLHQHACLQAQNPHPTLHTQSNGWVEGQFVCVCYVGSIVCLCVLWGGRPASLRRSRREKARTLSRVRCVCVYV